MPYPPTFRALAYAALASGLLLTSSCRRADVVADDVTSAEDMGQGNEENATTADLVDAAAPQDATDSASPTVADATELPTLLSGCATRTYVAATRTLTIDFGPTNCLCRDGRYRRGKIVAVFGGPYRQAGALTTVNLLSYFVNDNQHLGTRVFTSLGGGSFDLSVQNASIIFANNGGTASWTSLRRYTRTAGFGTRTLLDDAYSITGALTGTNRRNITFEATIQQPLIKKLSASCARHFVAGTVAITNSKEKSMLLDYDPTGTQACDNIATVTVNGHTRTITLR